MPHTFVCMYLEQIKDDMPLAVVDGFSTRLMHGMLLNPLTFNWSWICDTSVNYALHAVKSVSDSTIS